VAILTQPTELLFQSLGGTVLQDGRGLLVQHGQSLFSPRQQRTQIHEAGLAPLSRRRQEGKFRLTRLQLRLTGPAAKRL
jgi:hypothetical protein